jgi:site-specific DNA recombinase
MSKNKPILIPAVGYLRKSSKEPGYEKSLADQKDRIKKLEPADAGSEYEVVRWYTDPGVPGWKRGHKRPDYFRMVNDLREQQDVKAVLIDDMDRFSRADPMQTMSDVQALRELGVRYIHAANQGVKDLEKGGVMVTMQITMEANASHEFSTRLGRRMASARRDKAKQGKRSGGEAPYAMENDGQGGLNHGDREQVEIVQWLFDQFVNQLRSINWLAGDLNERHIPSPDGGKWWIKTISKLLRRKCYRGDFSFNEKAYGQFYGIDAGEQVVPKGDLNGPGKVFFMEGVYQPMVDPALFDRAQERLELLKTDRSRRKRGGYPLTGVLFCGHCGSRLHAVSQKRGASYSPTVYRCSYYNERGKGACGQPQIREDALLPFILRTLSEEIGDIKKLLSQPPEELVAPGRGRAGSRDSLLKERATLVARIEKGEKNLLRCSDDDRVFKSLAKQVSALRDQLDQLDAELAKPAESGYRAEELQALADWWDEFEATAVRVPVPKGQRDAKVFYDIRGEREKELADELLSDVNEVEVDPLQVNDAMLRLGCRVDLWWATKEIMSRAGGTYKRRVLVRGRFRLGQHKGKLLRYVLEPSGWRSPSAQRRRAGERKFLPP